MLNGTVMSCLNLLSENLPVGTVKNNENLAAYPVSGTRIKSGSSWISADIRYIIREGKVLLPPQNISGLI